MFWFAGTASSVEVLCSETAFTCPSPTPTHPPGVCSLRLGGEALGALLENSFKLSPFDFVSAGGFPDCTLWREDGSAVKLVEVATPTSCTFRSQHHDSAAQAKTVLLD